MSKRPFRVAVSATPLLPQGNVQVLVRIAARTEVDPQVRTTLRDVFAAFSTVGDWGGWAGEHHAPRSSTLKMLIDGQPAGRPTELAWAFDAQNIDAGLLNVIANVLHRMHSLGMPIDSLAVHYARLSGDSIPDRLPVDFEPHPFHVEYNMEGAQVLVDVELRERVDPKLLEPFARAWNAWELVAASGGFSDETYVPERSTLNVEDDLQALSTGLSANYDDVSIADAGFYCLVNMVQVLHHTLTPVESVTIE